MGNLLLQQKLDDDIITDNGLKSLEECGDTLVFMRNEEGEKRLHGANFCRNRLCPMCNWRRSLKMYSQVSQITDKILTTRKSRFIFVTLTVKNPDAEHLTETLDLMNKGFRISQAIAEHLPLLKNLKNRRAISRLLKSHITAKKYISPAYSLHFSSQNKLFYKRLY